jgi:hypothetical protein
MGSRVLTEQYPSFRNRKHNNCSTTEAEEKSHADSDRTVTESRP